MSVKHAQMFVTRLATDNSFRTRIESASVAERGKVLSDCGILPFTEQELRSAMGLAANVLEWSDVDETDLKYLADVGAKLDAGESLASAMCSMPLLLAMQVSNSGESPQPNPKKG